AQEIYNLGREDEARAVVVEKQRCRPERVNTQQALAARRIPLYDRKPASPLRQGRRSVVRCTPDEHVDRRPWSSDSTGRPCDSERPRCPRLRGYAERLHKAPACGCSFLSWSENARQATHACGPYLDASAVSRKWVGALAGKTELRLHGPRREVGVEKAAVRSTGRELEEIAVVDDLWGFVIGCRLCGLLDGNHLSWLLGLRDDKADSRWRQPVRQGGKKEESDFCEPMEGRLVGRQKHISAGLDPRMGFEAWPWCHADHYRGADAPARQELGEHERLREAA